MKASSGGPALLLLAAALSGCAACDGDRESRIDLGLRRPAQETPPEPSRDAPSAAPAGDEIADSEGSETGAPTEAPGDPAPDDRPSAAPAATGTAATGVGAAPPRER